MKSYEEDEEKKEKLDETLEFLKDLGKDIVITAATTVVSIGIAMLMHDKDV